MINLSRQFLTRLFKTAFLFPALFLILSGGTEAETLCIEETCRRISGKLASVSHRNCIHDGHILSGGYSNKGVPILVKEYPPLAQRRPQAKVLVVGGTHGDAYSSISIVFRWMQILDIHHSVLFHWIFIPLLNPDGLFLDTPTRTNAMGVDINRNFPAPLWGEIGFKRWLDVAKKDPRYYPGTHPSSEPETKFLVDLIKAFQPDAIISIHSPLNLVDYDSPGTPPSQIGSLRLLRHGNFPGTLGNYVKVLTQMFPITISLPPTFGNMHQHIQPPKIKSRETFIALGSNPSIHQTEPVVEQRPIITSIKILENDGPFCCRTINPNAPQIHNNQNSGNSIVNQFISTIENIKAPAIPAALRQQAMCQTDFKKNVKICLILIKNSNFRDVFAHLNCIIPAKKTYTGGEDANIA